MKRVRVRRTPLGLVPVLVAWACLCSAVLGGEKAEIYDGKVYGIFDPLCSGSA